MTITPASMIPRVGAQHFEAPEWGRSTSWPQSGVQDVKAPEGVQDFKAPEWGLSTSRPRSAGRFTSRSQGRALFSKAPVKQEDHHQLSPSIILIHHHQ